MTTDVRDQVRRYAEHVDAMVPTWTVDEIVSAPVAAERRPIPGRAWKPAWAIVAAFVVALAVVGIVSLALRGGDDDVVDEPPTPTTTVDTESLEAAPAIVIDLAFAGEESPPATVAIDDQGRALALYGPAGDEEGVTTLVRCLDAQCSERAAANLPAVTGIVEFTTEGFPLLLLDETLVRCHDMACATFTSAQIPGDARLGMTLDGEGNPVVAVALLDPGRPAQISVVWCRDPMCESTDTAVLGTTLGFDYPGRFELLPGGQPILFYRTMEDQRALVCRDPECRQVDEHDLTQAAVVQGIEMDPGLPVRGMVTVDQEVRLWLAGCTDEQCSTFVRTEVGRIVGGIFDTDLAGAIGFLHPDGAPVVIANGVVDDRFEAALVACADPSCDVFYLTRLGATAGLMVDAASNPAGALAITFNRDGRMWLVVCDDPRTCTINGP